MDLVEALDADDGVVAAVGAGGKKSMLYTLADSLERAVVTATVRIPLFDGQVASLVVTESPADAIASATAADWPLGLVPRREPDRSDRYLGYDPAVVDDIADCDGVGTVLVKADGARMRKFKAPADTEPQLPMSTTVVAPVVSAHVIGQPLSAEYVHRVDRVADLTGLTPGQIMTPESIATVLASDRGGCKDAPADATVIPVINMVDDDALRQRARGVARATLEADGIDRVVLTQLNVDEPVVDVLESA